MSSSRHLCLNIRRHDRFALLDVRLLGRAECPVIVMSSACDNTVPRVLEQHHVNFINEAGERREEKWELIIMPIDGNISPSVSAILI